MGAETSIPVRVLVVEDEPVVSQVCERSLGRSGYSVTLVEDGRAAQEKLITGTFDLCLIDVRTPRMNGVELFSWIRTERPEMIPGVIFTTGDVIANDTKAFLATSECAYLPKPFSPSELLEIVGEVMALLK